MHRLRRCNREEAFGSLRVAGPGELAHLVDVAGGGLCDVDREVVDLAYRHGLDGSELAQVLGLSPANTNALIVRLRQTVQQCLGPLPSALLCGAPVFLPAPGWLRRRTLDDVRLTGRAWGEES